MHGVFHQGLQGVPSDDTRNGGDNACFSESPRGLLDKLCIAFCSRLYYCLSTTSFMKGSDILLTVSPVGLARVTSLACVIS